MENTKQVASAHKIGWHQEKIRAYLNGEVITPVTVELDITSKCTRICEDCPSCRSPIHMNMDMSFLDNLMASFEGQTKGVLMTGGEPTSSENFPKALQIIKSRGIEELAVVTNGSELAKPHVADALLEHASTIRISMYDWDENSCGGIAPVLEKIAYLRRRVQETKSSLQIGISALTNEERVPRLSELAQEIKKAGADWIYFHPMCTGWGDAHLVPMSQKGVVEEIRAIKNDLSTDTFGVHISENRYVDTPIIFQGYHAAHFMMVVGADGKNYLGAEVKYQPNFVIGDIHEIGVAKFLHDKKRAETIAHVTSDNYSALKSRHRGVLYNHFIETLKNGFEMPEVDCKFPHIL